MAARVFSAVKRISRPPPSSQHLLWNRTYRSSRSSEPPMSGLEECTARYRRKLREEYEDHLAYLLKKSKELDCEMKRIKNSISEDLSSMGHLEKLGAPHMSHKLNLPFQTENCSRDVVNEWEKVQVSLKIMDGEIAVKCNEVKRRREKRVSFKGGRGTNGGVEETVLVARTDAVGATLIQSNVDYRDHQFILGATNPNLRGKHLASLFAEAMAAGKTGSELQVIEDNWLAAAQLKTFSECVVDAIKNMNAPEDEKRTRLNEWMNHSSFDKCLSNEQGREIAERLGLRNLFWDWDLPRTREGFYRFKGSVMAAVVRGRAFAPHADLIWMETASPDMVELTNFAEGMKSARLETMLAYNLSPSFNWDASGMTDDQMRDFIPRIAKLGYCCQFITLAGFHADALIIDTFAKDYSKRGMLAYVEKIQREERNHGVDTLSHQNGPAQTTMIGISRLFREAYLPLQPWEGVTEEQFKETWTRPGDTQLGNEGNLVVAKARM